MVDPAEKDLCCRQHRRNQACTVEAFFIRFLEVKQVSTLAVVHR